MTLWLQLFFLAIEATEGFETTLLHPFVNLCVVFMGKLWKSCWWVDSSNAAGTFFATEVGCYWHLASRCGWNGGDGHSPADIIQLDTQRHEDIALLVTHCNLKYWGRCLLAAFASVWLRPFGIISAEGAHVDLMHHGYGGWWTKRINITFGAIEPESIVRACALRQWGPRNCAMVSFKESVFQAWESQVLEKELAQPGRQRPKKSIVNPGVCISFHSSEDTITARAEDGRCVSAQQWIGHVPPGGWGTMGEEGRWGGRRGGHRASDLVHFW